MSGYITLAATGAALLLLIALIVRMDNREKYLRDGEGYPVALVVVGPQADPILGLLGIFNTPDHERIVHDVEGTPHRNPAVFNRWRIAWFLFVPYLQRYQKRWYSMHVSDDGRSISLFELQARVNETPKAKGQSIYLARMSYYVRFWVEIQESKDQIARGVPLFLLNPLRSFRR